MERYQAVCLDLDGTVYKGIEPIPEAVTFIDRLQDQGVEPYFITNNSSMTREQIREKLLSFQIQADSSRIMTSAIAAAKYCVEHFNGGTVMMIGEKGLEEALELEGIRLTGKDPDVVIMGIDREITYAKLADACLALRNGAHFIATNSDRAFPTERGLVPGNGSFVALMESASGQKPVFVGKPEPHMLGFIQQDGQLGKEQMIMIGDNYDTDIMAGIRFGIDTAHVAGGVTSPQEVLQKDSQPTYQFHTLLDWFN
ncbi:HAD family hydrolase [Bacillus sp. OxB-1]|uniref:TIGR01457 family HAD-type hydrolase n=1 Tax=Bacillus sp. (strain OxB-1) TaxID=98228 RepID=UPI0005820271|nr:TIGR01457 family HAD-type hydrolase [Bacillus sp. OxB-1]BAQ08528.1 HAD family hydrolase [Bacillus sp. OxB-1]